MADKDQQKLEKIKENKSFLKKLWADPVWSKIISAALLSSFAFVFALVRSLFGTLEFSKINFLNLINEALSYPISVFWILMFTLTLALIITGVTLFKRWKSKRSIVQDYFNVDQKIGEFTFKELYNSLLSNYNQTPPYLIAAGYPDRDSLLVLWRVHLNYLNMGVTIDDIGDHARFLYFQLGPLLISYGLVRLTSVKSFDDKRQIPCLISTNEAATFFANMEKWMIYKNINNIKDPLIYEHQAN